MKVKSFIVCRQCGTTVYEKRDKDEKIIYFCPKCEKNIAPEPSRGWQ